jgi:hypothetical protein
MGLFNSHRQIAFSDVEEIYLETIQELTKISNFKDTHERAVLHSEIAGVCLLYKKLHDKLSSYKENEING